MLSSKQLGVVISRFRNSCTRLEKSGDYPEYKEDIIILRELVDLQYKVIKKEQKEELNDM